MRKIFYRGRGFAGVRIGRYNIEVKDLRRVQLRLSEERGEVRVWRISHYAISLF